MKEKRVRKARYHFSVTDETHTLLCAYRRKMVDELGAHVSLAAALRLALERGLDAEP